MAPTEPAAFRTVTIDDRECIVYRETHDDSWEVRFWVDDPDATDWFLPPVPSEERRERALTYALRALRAIEVAYPTEYALARRGTHPNGDPTGQAYITAIPPIVAEALRLWGIDATGTMQGVAARVATFGSEWKNPMLNDGALLHCLAAALDAGDVPAQKRWAAWIVDPDAAGVRCDPREATVTPDDLYVNGLRDVPTEAILRLAEHVLDLAAAAGLESDDRPRLALAMLKRGETLAALREYKPACRGSLDGPQLPNHPWKHVVRMVWCAAVLIYDRDASRVSTDSYAVAREAASVVLHLGMFGRVKGSGRQAHDYVRGLLVKFSVNTAAPGA